ncbi:MAG: anti-sigma factor [Erythrobacter sp.]|uniref:anti-sigma factor n=1 Tax=Erythrobacter sp. TaxID=1042 RepID=UPI0032EDC4AA
MNAGEDMQDGTPGSEPVLAAEYALGLLEGEALLTARGRMASDPVFAAEVRRWEERLAPLLDEVPAAMPSSEVWQRIEARVNAIKATRAEGELAGGGASPANVVELRESVRRWQWTAGLTSLAAAVALALLVFSPDTAPAPVPKAPEDAPFFAEADPLVATVPIGDTGLRLDVTYIPETERMVVAAIGLSADGVHDHELWLAPPGGGELQSLGVVEPGEIRSMKLPDTVARNLGEGAGLVLTREPLGGKPEGVDAGPVVAEGSFSEV